MGATIGGDFILAELSPAHDGTDYIIEIVGDAAGKLANGFELLKLPNFPFGLFVVAAYLRIPEFAMDGRQQPRQAALEDIILSAAAHGLDGDVFSDGAGNEDEGNIEIDVANDFEGGDAAESGHGEIGDHAIPYAFAQRGVQAIGGIDALMGHLIAAVVKSAQQQSAILLGVLDNERAQRGGHLGLPIGIRARPQRVRGRRAFVEEQPVKTELAYGVDEFGEIDGLAHVTIGAQAVALEAIPFLIGGGENDHGEELGLGSGTQTAQHLQAIDLRQLQIENDDLRDDGRVAVGVGAGGEQIVQGFGAIASHHHFVGDVVLAEGPKGESFIIGIIFDQQNDAACHFSSSF